jgi:hypothetical protein
MRPITPMVIVTAACLACSATDGGRRSVRDVAGRQQERIEQGVDEGSLTPGEARNLRERQRDIRDRRREAAEDGTIDRGERRDIRQEQRKASKQIWKQKNDDDTRD